MKVQFALLIVCLISTCSLTLAQTTTRSDENWRIIQPENEEFTVAVPIDLKSVGARDLKSPRKYSGSIDSVYLYVFSDPIKDRYYFSIISGFLKNWGQTLEISDSVNKPILLSFRDQYGFWQNILAIRTETRIYLAQTVSRDADDITANRFIKSFGIGTGHSFEIPPAKASANESEPQVSKAADPSPSKGGGIGTGSGIGSGSGTVTSGITTGLPAAAQKPSTMTPLKLLSKPRPAYTEMARFYEISGTIITRVTFLASGEIGAVTPITSLPFGLTQRAIEAAKSIRFEPMTRDGNPINVVKQVEYSFLIY